MKTNEPELAIVGNLHNPVNNVPEEVAAMPVTLLPAKLPLAGTLLFIRPGLTRNGFWVKFTRIETWCHPSTGVRQWVYMGDKVNRRCACVIDGVRQYVFTAPKLNETWTFTADTIVKPRLYTAVRHDRLLRVTPHLPPIGGSRMLKAFCEAAGYKHVVAGYSVAKSLYPDVSIVRGPEGCGIAAPF